MAMLSHKETFYKDVNIHVEIEPYEGETLVHCNVYRLSPSIMRKLYTVFVQLQDTLSAQGIYSMRTVSPNIRFCEMFNGEILGTFRYEGQTYGVVKWEWTP